MRLRRYDGVMKTLLLTATVVLVGTAAQAGIYQVTPTGDDAATGTTGAPWQTLQHAADTIKPGDPVMIAAGTYKGFQISTQGTEQAPVAFIGEAGVMIDGHTTADQDAVHIDGASWVTVQGLTVTGATRSGISAIQADHITV